MFCIASPPIHGGLQTRCLCVERGQDAQKKRRLMARGQRGRRACCSGAAAAFSDSGFILLERLMELYICGVVSCRCTLYSTDR